MATKTKLSRIELDVEKYRAAGNWAKLLDLSKQITSKGSDQGIQRLISSVTRYTHSMHSKYWLRTVPVPVGQCQCQWQWQRPSGQDAGIPSPVSRAESNPVPELLTTLHKYNIMNATVYHMSYKCIVFLKINRMSMME